MMFINEDCLRGPNKRRVARILCTWGILMGMVVAAGYLLFVVLSVLDGDPKPEVVTYEQTIEDRFHDLELEIEGLQGQIVLAKRLALAGSEENALASVYANMAAAYYGVLWGIDNNGITLEAAGIRIAAAVESDEQLRELWALVITSQAPVRTFELLLLTKLWVSMTRGLAPALDG